MPGSCSSNVPNGCAGCGPVLHLFYLERSVSQSKAGCFYEGGYYRKYSRNFQSSYYINAVEQIDGCVGDPTNSGWTGSLKVSDNYNYEVDEFGNIAIYVTGRTSTSTLGWLEVCCAENDAYSPGFFYAGDSNGTSVTVSAATKCNPTATKTTETCDVNDPDFLGFNCQVGCLGPSGDFECGRYIRCEDIEKCTSPVDLQFFYGLAQSSASKKIDISQNNKPQNCAGTTCGQGKDACWALYTAPYFFITDNNLNDPNANSTTSQKLKFKIGTIKEGFDKKYKSVSGTVKFYYGGTGGKTPCCNDDFDGTVLKEGGYSISAGSTFKNNFFASDAGDLDNSDQSAVGQAIYVCATIDNISFF